MHENLLELEPYFTIKAEIHCSNKVSKSAQVHNSLFKFHIEKTWNPSFPFSKRETQNIITLNTINTHDQTKTTLQLIKNERSSNQIPKLQDLEQIRREKAQCH